MSMNKGITMSDNMEVRDIIEYLKILYKESSTAYVKRASV
jgi:hypothetical protein